MMKMMRNKPTNLPATSGGRESGGHDWEMRPGGMLVQKRNPDSDPVGAPPPPMIRVKIKYGSLYHEMSISPQASFGELKKMLSGPTGIHHQDQKLMYKEKERDSKAFLDVSGVKDKSKMVLIEDPISQEKRFLEMKKIAKTEKASKAISDISLEVDRLGGRVSAFEMVINKGGKVAEKDLVTVIELLMNELVKLDGIVAEGDVKLQRKMQATRVQNYVEALDVLKVKSSMANGQQKQPKGRRLATIQEDRETLISHKLQVNHNQIRLKRSPNLPLRFRDDGTFKILQVADMHFGMGSITRCRDVTDAEYGYCSDLNTTQFLRRMIEAERPDLIAFTGDNIFGSSTTDAAESLLQAIGPAIEYGIPWAAILGNHDQESTMNRAELMTFLSLMDFSVSQINPPLQDGSERGALRSIDGFGNYRLRVHGAPGSVLSNSTVFDLFFLDSGDRETVQGRRTYGWIKDSQLSWLQDASKQNMGNVPSNPDPALAFFHIPIPEVRDLWYTPFIGQFQEGVACSIVQSGVLSTFLSMGNVKAAFIGHDHVNDFCGNLKGVWFCYGGGFGYHAYGRRNWHRRSRLIEAKLGKGKDTWTGVQRIKTWKRLDDGDLCKIDEQVLWEASYSFLK